MNPVEGPFILVNPERCLGCHTCEMACAVAHTGAGSVIGSVLAGERLIPRNRVVQVQSVKLSTQCRQCEDAPCVRVCPTGATYRTETYTAVDQRRCIGCRLCMLVCPYLFSVLSRRLKVGSVGPSAGRRPTPAQFDNRAFCRHNRDFDEYK